MTEGQIIAQMICFILGGVSFTVGAISSDGFTDWKGLKMGELWWSVSLVILGLLFMAPGLLSIVVKAWLG